MTLHKRYTSTFYSVKGVKYTIDILQAAAQAWPVKEISLAAEPLIIDWEQIEKHTPLQGSSATLTIISDSDRAFIDLYHIKVGEVRLDVYRDDELYWSGIMDTELYEEPYSFEDGYEVSLSFTDINQLRRMKWNKKGLISLGDAIETCVSALHLPFRRDVTTVSPVRNYGTLTELNINYHISTSRDGKDILDNDILRCDNFYDENDEAMTLQEVLETILQPYELHLCQRCGAWEVWDWNAIAAMPAAMVEWTGTDAVMGVDRVYNNIDVELSAYQSTDLINEEIEEFRDGECFDIRSTPYGENGKFEWDLSFKMYLKKDAEKKYGLHNDAYLCSIRPVVDGSDTTCVCVMFKTHTIPTDNPDYVFNKQIDATGCGEVISFLSKQLIVPDTQKYLKLGLEALCDVRYNPYREPSKFNRKSAYQGAQKSMNFMYVPAKILLHTTGGSILHLNNTQNINKRGCNLNAVWMDGEGQLGEYVYSYYGEDNTTSAILGWKKNLVGRSWNNENNTTEEYDYVSLPPYQGYIEVILGSQLQLYDVRYDFGWEKGPMSVSYLTYVLYKIPSVTLVDQYRKDIETEDVIYSTHIDDDIEEELTITTKLGTLEENQSTARAQIQDKVSKLPTSIYSRAGNRDRLETLLCASYYKHYASRHNTLSGTASIFTQLTSVTDQATEGLFAILSESQNIRLDESEILICQL